jgi:3-methyladenine DNA glycosylase/8-oxoguanine DNA glycosylase
MPYLTEASRALAALDPTMAELAARHGPMHVPTRPTVARRFEAMARTIAYQQLAGKAAASIWARVEALADGQPFAPAVVLALSNEQLRGAGLSGSKAAAIVDLAWQVDTGAVRLDRVGRMDDAAVEAELIKVRGVGPWTAHMFLMFELHRLDVWPTGDYGVRAGYREAYGLTDLPAPKELDLLGARFRPYRSIAAWYCWRAVDTTLPD